MICGSTFSHDLVFALNAIDSALKTKDIEFEHEEILKKAQMYVEHMYGITKALKGITNDNTSRTDSPRP